MRIASLRTGILSVLVLSASTTLAADPDPARLDALERRMADMERRHREEMAARDREIAALRALLQPDPPAAPRPEFPPASRPATAPAADKHDHHDHSHAGHRHGRDPDPWDLEDDEPAKKKNGWNFDPEITVTGIFQGNVSTANENPARNRWDTGLVEFALRAPVAPMADAVLIVPVVREVHEGLIFDSTDESEGVETNIEIEEAYLYLHDFGVPNLTAKLGRFHLAFGRQNLYHIHEWPTITAPLVGRSFLSHEALSDSGVSIGYAIPAGANRFELTAEIITGEGGGEEAPVLNNTANIDVPAFNLHGAWKRQFGAWNLEAGTSWLTAKRNDDNRQNVNLFGLDFTATRKGGKDRVGDTLIRAEAIFGHIDTSRDESQHAWGAYLLVQQQLTKEWLAGLRLDWTEDATDDRRAVWALSPHVMWQPSDGLRFRLEYQHVNGDAPDEHTLWFQAIFSVGGHHGHDH